METDMHRVIRTQDLSDDVLVVEVTQKLHLTQRPQAKHAVVERCDLLDGHLLPGRLVKGGAVHNAKSALHTTPSARVCTYHTTP